MDLLENKTLDALRTLPSFAGLAALVKEDKAELASVAGHKGVLADMLQGGLITQAEHDATLERLPQVELYKKMCLAVETRFPVAELRKALNDNGLPGVAVPPLPELLPLRPPPMTAELEKPYTSVWFEGQMHDIRNLRGGHNGRVSGACVSNGAIYNPELKRWEIRVANNLIHFDFPTPSGPVTIRSIEPEDKKPEGLVVPENRQLPTVPAVSTFEVRLEALMPGGLRAVSRETLKLRALVNSWPPPPDTVYMSERPVGLYLENAGPDDKPFLIINPDQTVVKTVTTSEPPPPGN